MDRPSTQDQARKSLVWSQWYYKGMPTTESILNVIKSSYRLSESEKERLVQVYAHIITQVKNFLTSGGLISSNGEIFFEGDVESFEDIQASLLWINRDRLQSLGSTLGFTSPTNPASRGMIVRPSLFSNLEITGKYFAIPGMDVPDPALEALLRYVSRYIYRYLRSLDATSHADAIHTNSITKAIFFDLYREAQNPQEA
jgi:hypothetical protein